MNRENSVWNIRVMKPYPLMKLNKLKPNSLRKEDKLTLFELIYEFQSENNKIINFCDKKINKKYNDDT